MKRFNLLNILVLGFFILLLPVVLINNAYADDKNEKPDEVTIVGTSNFSLGAGSLVQGVEGTTHNTQVTIKTTTPTTSNGSTTSGSEKSATTSQSSSPSHKVGSITLITGQGGASVLTLAGGSDIFGKLSSKAAIIGEGLQTAGFIIAGFGLIVFSFMAIFNKVSWKNLAYIMMSCFILSFMVLVISFVREKGDQNLNVSFDGGGNASTAKVTSDGTQPAVSKTK